MKNKFLKATVAGLCLSVSIISNVATAGLIDRGNGMIYDTEQDITWLKNANLAGRTMGWPEALNWADTLTFGGYEDWRLFNTSATCGLVFNCVSDELGHLFYNELGGEPNAGTNNATGAELQNLNMFVNIQYGQNGSYWGASYTSPLPDYRKLINENRYNSFQITSGSTQAASWGNTFHAWAVRDGDVAASSIPEPSSLAILGLGLMGLASRRFKKS